MPRLGIFRAEIGKKFLIPIEKGLFTGPKRRWKKNAEL